MNTTNNNTARQLFPNLFSTLASEVTEHSKHVVSLIDSANDLKSLDVWQINYLMPKGRKLSFFTSLDEAKVYLLKRVDKAHATKLDKIETRLNTIANAGEFTGANISIEWKRSQMWGSNPSAEGWDNFGRYTSGSISGCGYDKQSTAVANVLNQSNALLKLLYLVKEQNVSVTNRELFGYGSGYGILPSIEGGVGVSCYDRIFEKIGFKFKTVASGKHYDAYSIEKIA